jgi:hypothetical protein
MRYRVFTRLRQNIGSERMILYASKPTNFEAPPGDQEKKDMAIEETREYIYTPPKYSTAGRTNKKPTSP